MAEHITLTAAQVAALETIVAERGIVSLRQLAHTDEAVAGDVYATAERGESGFRVAIDGTVTDMRETVSSDG